MKKLELQMDDLVVDSFPTEAADEAEAGSVEGQEIPTKPYCSVFPYCFTRMTYDCPCTP